MQYERIHTHEYKHICLCVCMVYLCQYSITIIAAAANEEAAHCSNHNRTITTFTVNALEETNSNAN